MAQRTFRARIRWDPDAKVYYSDSDIDGLHIESPSLDEFEEVLMDVAPDLIVANHSGKAAAPHASVDRTSGD